MDSEGHTDAKQKFMNPPETSACILPDTAMKIWFDDVNFKLSGHVDTHSSVCWDVTNSLLPLHTGSFVFPSTVQEYKD
jgi:hypothetical protein